MAHVGILIGARSRGSNMLALCEACADGRVPAEVSVVISEKEDTPGAISALQRGLNVAIVPFGENYGERLLHALEGVNWVCLAGYLRLLPNVVLHKYPDHVLNIHPALLPEFG